jgi:hypothetical protein
MNTSHLLFVCMFVYVFVILDLHVDFRVTRRYSIVT